MRKLGLRAMAGAAMAMIAGELGPIGRTFIEPPRHGPGKRSVLSRSYRNRSKYMPHIEDQKHREARQHFTAR